ncbi:MAG TPA: hypothetical protein VF411_07270 [Bacteroidia bacterium]
MTATNKPKLLFTKRSLPLILEAFGKSINEDGLIIDTKTGEPVFTPENEEIEATEFGGLKKGSEKFIKSDLYSIMNLAEGKY